MQTIAQKGFVHSIKVPRIYKVASVIVKKVVEDGGSLKNLVYSSGHQNVKGIYALVAKTIKHFKDLDKLLKYSKLCQKEPRLQPWLARVLITELLYGKRILKGQSKPVQTVLHYKKQLEILSNKNKALKRISVPAKKPRYVRVNTLKHTPDEIIKILRKDGWSFLPVPSCYSEFLKIISRLEDKAFMRDFHIKELLVFSSNAEFHENELYKNGSILLQDKASCLPACLLKPKPNSVVLDMCAAPGMKTTHLSAIMKNKGKIYATEIDIHRFKILCNIVQTSGCTNVVPVHMDALNINEGLSWAKDVEYIMVDPSCTGSGIIERQKIFSDEKKNPKRLKKLCRFQFTLLKHALTNFPKVKRVVYSTCSVHYEENEMVVEDILKMFSSLENNEIPTFKLTEPLKETWPRRGHDEFQHGRLSIFSDPKKDLTNGFFVAVFEKVNENVDIE